MSFREKSAWISLGITLVVFVPYFSRLLGPLTRNEFPTAAILPLFLGAVALQTVLIVVAVIAIAILSREEPADERDRAIDATAHRFAYYVLSTTSAVALLGLVALSVVQSAIEAPLTETVAIFSQIVFFCLILAEVVRNVTQVVGYRRSA